MEMLMRIYCFLFFLTLMFLSATEGVNIKLKGIQGGSITFPEPLVRGFLIFESNIIANVKDGQLNILEDSYTDRLFWNNTTGDFTLRELQKNDSGDFAFNIKQGVGFSIKYELTVYEPVVAPEVRVNVSGESCTLQCFVKKPEETTLLWYRDEEVLNQSSSADPSLPLTVHRQDITSSYRCVAANPVENKTLNVDVNITCWREDGKSGDLIIFPVVLAAVVVLCCALFIRWWSSKNKKKTTETQADSVGRESDLEYSYVKISEARPSQVRVNPASSGPEDTKNLTTIYSQLQLKHISTVKTALQTTNHPHA